jgi:3-hydroxy-9,10-secoandrosta-1,3,5(10)-triene-9,17-dione monooxygenase
MQHNQTEPRRDPVQNAAALRPLLTRNAARAEQARRLPTENVEALQSFNLFRVMMPRRWNGYGASFPVALSTFAEIAQGCASSGWVTMILGGVNWWASLLPDRGQEEIFANSLDTKVCAAGSPAPTVRQVDGGLRISGKFPFASGCLHAEWGGLSVTVMDDSKEIVDQVTAFSPISELEIEDTWFVAGMCGTGSNTLVAKDVFVPAHRLLSMTKDPNADVFARHKSQEPSDRYPFSAVNALIGIAPILGIAKAMADQVIEGSHNRGITFTTYTRQADAPVIQRELAKVSLQIDSARLLVMNAAAELEEAAVSGKPMDYVARARTRGLVGYASGLIREAVDALASIGGASGFANSNPLQRMWRDASVAARHGVVTTDPGLEIFGRALLGFKDNIAPLV